MNEVDAYIVLYGFVAVVASLAFWFGEREDAKHRSRQRRIHRNIVLIMKQPDESLEECSDRLDDFERRLKERLNNA